jgi:hypothetical protein
MPSSGLYKHYRTRATGVTIATNAPERRVMYATSPIEKKELYCVTARMDKSGLVATYTLHRVCTEASLVLLAHCK